MTEEKVRVAVRIRPQLSREIIDQCHVCTSVASGEPQIWLGKDKAFTFDHVFNMATTQETVYQTCIKDLIDGCLKGLNVTILAYGQTGSGKTYSMGTGFDVTVNEEEVGIIPRAVNQLFNCIAKHQNEAQNCQLPPPEFQVSTQFTELYNEEIIDLLNPVSEEEKSKKSGIKIHEDLNGQILLVGLSSRVVSSASEALQCLKIGALSRTTASTRMNTQSSRSHAIFTLYIKQQKLIKFEPTDGIESDLTGDFESLTSKLHFVDLAGSERLKRTGAIGDRAREGISINSGLLVLGNVISALGDKTRRATHVPYRDSKLTRLLQDSLGGNSQTLMIACISPSDRDFVESLSTLKYANRAKNIRNMVTINEDKSSITLLRQQVQQLQLELMEYKEGKRKIGEDGEVYNDMFHENQFLLTENKNLRSRLKALQEAVEHQTKKVTELLAEKTAGTWITSGDNESQSDITEVIKGYLSEIENLRVQLLESEEMCSQLRKQAQHNQSRTSLSSPFMSSRMQALEDLPMSPDVVLQQAKLDVQALSKQARALGKEKFEKNGFKEEDKLDDEKEKDDTPQDKANDEGSGESEGFEDSDESSLDSDSEEIIADETCDLAELTHDISIKQKLIEALEQSQQRLHMLKHRYEEKLQLLETKIKETENERDRVLTALGANKENKSESKVKRVKEEFSNKLASLQSELKKMQALKKDHVLAMRNQAQYERQITQLKNEVTEMKRTKVRLMNKIKDDTKHHLLSEQKRNREIAQLRKQSRQKENMIRNLEAEKRMKENALRRKQEEIMALRKSAIPRMSDKVAGRFPRKVMDTSFTIHRKKLASPKEAKCRWQRLEKQINELVITRQSVNNTEKQMEWYLQERETHTRKMDSLKEKRKAALLRKEKTEIIKGFDDDIENLKETIDYCQENIAECQTTIVQIEEAKEGNDLLDVDEFVSAVRFQEARYLLGKLINMSINQTSQVFQKEASLKELEAKLKASTDSNTRHLELLERAVNNGNTEVLDFINFNNEDMASESQCSSRSSSPIESISEATFIIPSSEYSRPKKRPRKTGLPHELMGVDLNLCNPVMTESCPSVDKTPEKPSASRLAWSFGGPALEKELDLDKTLTPSSNPNEDKNGKGMVRVTSAPTSLQEMLYGRKSERSPLTKRRNREKQSHMAEFSPVFNRKFSTNASVIPLPSLSRQSSTDTAISDTTPPNSPGATRKNSREDTNVFNRLTSGSFRMSRPCTGEIKSFSSRTNQKHFPLVCTHTAEGHSRAILSLHATDDVLFSASKDRTVKIWDLVTGKEIQSLGNHPNNVCGVRYSEYSRLAFSVSMSYIKVWDVRENPAVCIQTLSSSGASNAGNNTSTSTSLRTLQMPKGEHQINYVALNRYGSTLFSAADNLVRIWDMRMYKAVGKLSGGHQAAIMCLAVDNDGSDRNVVVTGSKDHYIKVFEVMEGSGGVQQVKTNLNPPHYDGIQSLAINGNILFSGSRDMCIKKWNLKSGSPIQSLNQAHKDWINGLTFLPNNNLLSACRGGFLKLWTNDSTQLIGEIKAHSSSINAIATNSSSIFTASSDCTIGIWRLKNNSDLSPDNDSEL